MVKKSLSWTIARLPSAVMKIAGRLFFDSQTREGNGEASD